MFFEEVELLLFRSGGIAFEQFAKGPQPPCTVRQRGFAGRIQGGGFVL